MKLFLRVLKWAGILLIIIIIGLVLAVFTKYPPKFDKPYPAITASTDSAVIARGKYLVYGPAHCAECHVSKLEEVELLGKGELRPLIGGMKFSFPGAVIHSKNLTPDKTTGIGRYNDAELARIIRYGVRPDNEALIPFMLYSNVSDEDLTAIISYLRTIPPVKHDITANQLSFLMKGILAFFIKPFEPNGEVPKTVPRDTTIEYGKYLATAISGCDYCHTKTNQMTGAYEGPLFAGGGKTPSATEEPGVWVITPNLTPDPETGRITNWSLQQFQQRFHAGRVLKESIMPWETFKNYSDDDLKAIYKYLHALQPIKNEIGVQLIRE